MRQRPSRAPLIAALERAVVQGVGDIKAQELANTAWAYARAAQSDAPLFKHWREQ